MDNLWETIAKARGVELNEEFKWNDLTYKITDYDGLLVLDCSGVWMWVKSKSVLSFIRGGDDCVIERLPFRPQRVEVYYTIIHNTATVSYHWGDTTADYERLIAGVVFRTREEAEAYIPTWIERINKL